MSTADRSSSEGEPPRGGGAFEAYPLTRPEYISAMVHFYRGEMYRSQVWRTRLDATTNWSVVTVAGMISFAFSSPDHSPFTLILANVMIGIFLTIEARRYRYFSVFRARVRMLEENFYLPLIRRDLTSPNREWGELVATDLDSPTFKITFRQAVLFRLRRNYIWMFGLVLITWLVKLFMHPTPVAHFSEMFGRMGIGPIPSWITLSLVLLFYCAIGAALMTPEAKRAAVDEVRGQESELDHWKT